MSSSQPSYDPSDLEKLNDQDKEDLRQFLAKEQQRSQIQSQTHVLANICWKKCITGNIKKSNLDSSEETCISNCVDRFLDLNFLTMKHLNNMRGA